MNFERNHDKRVIAKMSGRNLVNTEKDLTEINPKDGDNKSLVTPDSSKLESQTNLETKEEPSPSNTKVQITMKIDSDVLNYFKERASAPHSAPYQTQINNELRAIMENSARVKVKGKKVKGDFEKLLTNKKFIKALAKEVKKVA